MTELTFLNAHLEAGKLIIDIPPEHRGSAMRFVRTKKDKPYDLTIKEHRNKRSNDANAYAWVLIGKLADAMRIPPNMVYKQAIQNIGGNYEIIPIREDAAAKFKEAWERQGIGWPCIDMGASKIAGYRNLRAYYGSSTYDTHQMTQLIDSLVQDCKALDIETLSDEKLSLLVGEWSA